jgi:hypothetical protein
VVCISGATEHSMLFRASERLTATRTIRDRSSGVVLALSVQTLFVLLIVFSSSRLAPPRSPARETILLLHPLPQTAPRNIDARGEVLHRAPPVAIPVLPTIAPSALAPPTGIAGFGRALFGCAPEHYADLPPDEKAHCPKPGEGMAVNQPPDLLKPFKSRSKDEAFWLEEQAETRWRTECAGAVEVVKCMMQQSRAERRRAQAVMQKIADDKAAALQEPKRPLPHIGVRRN